MINKRLFYQILINYIPYAVFVKKRGEFNKIYHFMYKIVNFARLNVLVQPIMKQ